MPSIYDLKSRFQGILRPSVSRLAAAGITANQVTLAAVGLSLAGGAALALAPGHPLPLIVLPVLLFLRMAMNAVDGMLAREHDQKSCLGAVLNELGDVVSDIALYLPFALLPGVAGWLPVAICLLAVIGEMTGVVGIQIGASRRYDGPMGKSDRAVVFGTLGVFLGVGLVGPTIVDIVLGITALLGGVTIINRARHALSETKEPRP
ncbi:CDP-alcohol phosphatidyltransferase family protein [Stappia sp. ES.058]|uniref:CDP-alcohol phosphatidyltransferase family protein n=1 Tax=Stappia sp. ES.058 TaxID=1881061 RepID=UPI00087D27C4|nr:CDP-alcohol phosphatidyltransferase family protein [Stappia sp. ES.058]SDU23995.1 CDP-diacylglycerol--glycerol-3-phosphate 3-phosphatidyltransferase [Stappia sp. ES.058]